MYFGSGSSSGSGGGMDESEADADREDDDSDDENDEGSGISNSFSPVHPPPYTERPYLHRIHKGDGSGGVGVDEKGIIIEETHVNGMENIAKSDPDAGIYTSNGKSQKPHDINHQWEKKKNGLNIDDLNNNNIDGDIEDRDGDVDRRSNAFCHRSCSFHELSIRSALLLYLVPLYHIAYNAIDWHNN